MTAGLDARLEMERPSGFRLGVELSVPPGRTAALLGPNGAGKSTVVAALAGLIALDAGRIILDGEVLDDPVAGVLVPPERRRVGVVFQDYLLFPHLSVIDNIAFGLADLGQAREWVSRLGLEGLERRRPGELSGGQAQRVALARALAPGPRLLLLDEPLAALDVTTRARTRHLLAEHLAAFPGPRLVVTHDPIEAFLLADEIYVVEAGEVTQVGTADDLRLRPRTPYAADLAGTNLLAGVAADGEVRVGEAVVQVADHEVAGPVLLTIRPTAVALHRDRPGGSPRNAWPTTVEGMEVLGERVRVRTGAPLPLTVEVTRAAAEELDLGQGAGVWIAVKATEIGVEEDPDG